MLFLTITAIMTMLTHGIDASLPFTSNLEQWARLEACAGLPIAAPSEPFDGILVMVNDDAARGYRSAVPTTYVLTFAGSNFLRGGAVSPDGEYYAMPYGIINTVTGSDVRYVVQEIRIVSTGVVPRIEQRIPWRASFPVGTAFTSDGDIPAIRWLDTATIQFVSGTVSEGYTPVTVKVFEGDDMGIARGYPSIATSPDGTRAIMRAGGGLQLIDTTTGMTLATLPNTANGALQTAWSPDSAMFAMTDLLDGMLSLRLYDADGSITDTILALEPERVLWNLRWSPDGTRLALTTFDPQTDENRLHVVDLEARTVTDTCIPVVADIDGRFLAGIAWSPDSTRIAAITRQTSASPHVQIVSLADRSRYMLIPAAGRLLGWYP